MGHTWREMCPDEAEASDKIRERLAKAIQDIWKRPTSVYTVGELFDILNATGITENFHINNERDTKTLERLAAKKE